MSFDYLMHEARAVPYLAEHLTKGTLVLFLGAGASMNAGLPDWLTLIHRLRGAAGMPIDHLDKNTSADDLQRAADEVYRDYCAEKDDKFAALVRQWLYDGVSLSANLLRDDLLIAVGALMMGSQRGNVSRVVTLNFDSVLEWYMSLCGFVPRIVTQPPMLEGAEDVRIYHPHGYLAHPDFDAYDSSFVILGAAKVNKRLGTIGDPWWELMRHLLQTGLCLFVGVSLRTLRDRALAPLLQAVGDEHKDSRPTAFWLTVESIGAEEKREVLGTNVVPLSVGSLDDVPPYLLKICRHAAGKVILA